MRVGAAAAVEPGPVVVPTDAAGRRRRAGLATGAGTAAGADLVRGRPPAAGRGASGVRAGAFGGLNEGADFRRVFPARRGFDTRGDVHGVGTNPADGFGDILGC